MASMWKLGRQISRGNIASRVQQQHLWKEEHINKLATACLTRCRNCQQNEQLDFRIQHVRHMSDGRKSFFSQFFDNIKQEMAKNKEMKENLKKFREEREKLEQSEAIQKARQKFESIESETLKSTEKFKKGLEDVKGKLSETIEEVQKTELGKKGKELTEEISKTAGKAAETLSKHGESISKSAPIKTISSGVKAVKEEIDEAALSQARTYRPPVTLKMRSDKSGKKTEKEYEADAEAMDMVLHKDSKWYQTWQNFKDNNQYLNKIFDLKTKYDESDNIVVRASRIVTDRVSSIFGGMFSPTETSAALTEICKMDPRFDKEKFIKWCEIEVIPNILEALMQGEEEVLKDWCYEAPYNVLIQPIKQAKAAGLKFDSKILDVRDVDLAAGKIMEQGPVLVISFSTQQIMVLRNAKGEITEGDPEKVIRINYVWALCRDQEELIPEAAWKLLDLSASSAEQFL